MLQFVDIYLTIRQTLCISVVHLSAFCVHGNVLSINVVVDLDVSPPQISQHGSISVYAGVMAQEAVRCDALPAPCPVLAVPPTVQPPPRSTAHQTRQGPQTGIQSQAGWVPVQSYGTKVRAAVLTIFSLQATSSTASVCAAEAVNAPCPKVPPMANQCTTVSTR